VTSPGPGLVPITTWGEPPDLWHNGEVEGHVQGPVSGMVAASSALAPPPVSSTRVPSEPAGPAASPRHSRAWRLRWAAIGVLSALYVAYTIWVLFPHTAPLNFDSYLLHRHLGGRYPQYHTAIKAYVILGQRGPATLVFLPLFFYVAFRKRSMQPLVLLLAGLIILNVSVGVVKYGLGRQGPTDSNSDVHSWFDWGQSFYPSGHVSNCVMLYGLIVWVAPRFRKTVLALSIWISISVGLFTIYLRTHWFSDVIGGWIAGGLILLLLPTVMPLAERWFDRLVAGLQVLFRPLPVVERLIARLVGWGQSKIPPDAETAARLAAPARVPADSRAG
jgi:membrane-associated phospholipid phosphatase